jgi:perosamine synthetase
MHVPVSKPLLGELEKKYVTDALNKGDISGFKGDYLKKFEDQFAEFCRVKHAVTVSSGTTALHLALVVLGIKEGDEVLVSSLTNMASFFAVLYQKARPIAIDCEPDTLNINPALIEAKITAKTKAIMVVHLYGHPVNMDPILEIAQKHHLLVVEDAAEAHGAEYKGHKVGSLADIGCFSFYANKIMTTGEGGMMTTNNDELAERARSLKALAFGKENKFRHQAVGYNYRLTNLQAALGCAQLAKIDLILKKKRQMAEYYLRSLSGIDGLQLPVEKDYAFNVYWMFNLVLIGKLSGKRQSIMSKLEKRGVEVREDFVPFNEQEIFIKQGLTRPEDCPLASRLGRDGFYIPSGTDISEAELEYVCRQIKEVVGLV